LFSFVGKFSHLEPHDKVSLATGVVKLEDLNGVLSLLSAHQLVFI
jgi:hypothetical protein